MLCIAFAGGVGARGRAARPTNAGGNCEHLQEFAGAEYDGEGTNGYVAPFVSKNADFPFFLKEKHTRPCVDLYLSILDARFIPSASLIATPTGKALVSKPPGCCLKAPRLLSQSPHSNARWGLTNRRHLACKTASLPRLK